MAGTRCTEGASAHDAGDVARLTTVSAGAYGSAAFRRRCISRPGCPVAILAAFPPMRGCATVATMTYGVGFGDVDSTGEPASFVVYLDTVGAMAAVQAYKRRILAFLGLRA